MEERLAQPEWEAYFNTQKPDGTFPYPFGTEDGEPYIFPVSDFPTRESVEAWFRFTDGDGCDLSEWHISDPAQYPIHDHDEDFKCPGDTTCPKLTMVEGRWAA